MRKKNCLFYQISSSWTSFLRFMCWFAFFFFKYIFSCIATWIDEWYAIKMVTITSFVSVQFWVVDDALCSHIWWNNSVNSKKFGIFFYYGSLDLKSSFSESTYKLENRFTPKKMFNGALFNCLHKFSVIFVRFNVLKPFSMNFFVSMFFFFCSKSRKLIDWYCHDFVQRLRIYLLFNIPFSFSWNFIPMRFFDKNFSKQKIVFIFSGSKNPRDYSRYGNDVIVVYMWKSD